MRRVSRVTLVVLGCSVAALGVALVLDLLSLRELSARIGPAPIERLIVVARSQVHHTGAQWGELVAALAGALLAILAARLLAPARR